MVKAAVMQYMEKAFLFQFDSEVTETTDLFKAGIMDSYGYVQMMQFIQSTFQVKFSKDELLSSVITSMAGLVAAVESKIDAKQRASA